MNGVFTSTDLDSSQYVEVDPTGRYGRYNEILGKGASKIVYRGFDEYEGIEVAWNQVKLNDFLQTPEDLERLYSEIHLLKTLKHNNIMKLYASWVDISNRNINFITEMFTSGTLRQYRLRHKRVNIRAVKHWCRQILRGLLYLHSHDPPVIHRDLKCDNIFVNGNQGEVKIGDLGLAAILRKSHADRCVGTPEFMAPEIYEEEYNELVDIYSFGMCILEMVTVEYPYSECLHPAQIYKKVISGKKPEALNKVEDPEVRQFVEKCLASVSHRLSASELLKDPFLQVDYYGSFLRPIDYKPETEASGFDLFSYQEDEHFTDVDITIKGKRGEADGIFFRLRIADQEGRIRNIYFPFDLETDTALSVANEMVSELDITDREVTKIADLIDSEISTLVPEWKSQIGVEEGAHCADSSFCHKCACYSSSSECVSPNHPSQCSNQGCAAAIHGRFEEITYQFDDLEMSSRNLTGAINHKESHENLVEQSNEEVMTRDPVQSNASAAHAFSDDFENEIRQELRWLRAKFHMQLREIKDQQLGVKFKSLSVCQSPEHKFMKKGKNKPPLNFTCQTPVHTLETIGESSSPEQMFTAKSFYTGALLPESNSLHRATSLPVDAIDF